MVSYSTCEMRRLIIRLRGFTSGMGITLRWGAGFAESGDARGPGDGVGACAFQDGTGVFTIDFDGYRALQQRDGEDEAVLLIGVDDDAFDAGEGAALDIDLA